MLETRSKLLFLFLLSSLFIHACSGYITHEEEDEEKKFFKNKIFQLSTTASDKFYVFLFTNKKRTLSRLFETRKIIAEFFTDQWSLTVKKKANKKTLKNLFRRWHNQPWREKLNVNKSENRWCFSRLQSWKVFEVHSQE